MKKLAFILIPPIIFGLIIFLTFQLIIKGRNEKGALQVTSFPESKVYLDDAYIGHTPLCKCEAADMIRSGEYTLRLVPVDEKISEFQDRVTITKSVLTVIDRKFGNNATSEGSVISLVPLRDSKATELMIISVPDQTEVFLDNNNVGKTPLLLKDVTESDHTLRIRKEGYKDKTVRIHTAAGYKLTANIYLAISDVTPSPTPTPTVLPSITTSPTPTSKITPTPSIRRSPTPSSRLTPTPTGKAKTVTILETPNGFLRVRETPSLAGAEITRVDTGDTFPYLSEENGWYQIKLDDGTLGWVSSQFAEVE
jgi:hypothetical protein